ncbi:MAG: C39 family peptidase [Parvularculaceae bacterium]|nr:C39 family peptidase [Parvularculaceae bacterium]
MARRTPHRPAHLSAWTALGVLAIALATPAATPAQAADFGVVGGGARPYVPVSTFADRKFKTIVRQQYDFSCGSAALATLLTHHYGRPTTERDAFETMWRVGDQARIRKLGFSMLEMKTFLETLGYRADGFRITLDRVAEVGVPGIALVEVKGYRHFVVVKGVTRDTVLVGDPAKGLIVRNRREFQSHWDGTILFIRSNVARGKTAFNQRADWSLAPDAPFGRALDAEALQSLALHQTRPSFSGVKLFE